MEVPQPNNNQPTSGEKAGFESTGAAASQLTNLKLADFRDADLSDAKLSTVSGLQSGKHGGSDVSNAKLPEDIAKFEGLDHVTEISKHARNIFLAVVGGCVFSWLTIATTTDVALLTNSGSSPLPIIQTKVPIAGFYWAAPAILLALYCYLHLYLQRLWEGMANLPAIFLDGRKLDECAYPWLLSGIVRKHVPLLKDKPQARLGLQVFVSLVAAWMFVPGTLGLFWLRYLPRHDWPWTLWLVAIFVFAVAFGTASYRLATTTLRGEPTTKPDAESENKAASSKWKRALRAIQGYRPDGYTTTAATLSLLISLGAIEGRPGEWTKDVRHWVYTLAEIADYYPALELVGEDVSFKPEDWSELGKEADELSPADLAEVKGAQLADRDLKYATAVGAFFLKANLPEADLRGTNLQGANLQGADLRDANLQGAYLKDAQPQGVLPLRRQPPEGRPPGGQPPGGRPQGRQPQGVLPHQRQPPGGHTLQRQPPGGHPRQRQPPEGRPQARQPPGGRPQVRQPPEGRPPGGQPPGVLPLRRQPPGGRPQGRQPPGGRFWRP